MANTSRPTHTDDDMNAGSAPTAVMHAWRLHDDPRPIDADPLEYVELPVPRPKRGEVLVKVLACGVCRTDLHVSEGDLPVHTPHVIPGHEIVGKVMAIAPGTDQHAIASSGITVGDRVGIAWLRHTCGTCEYCLAGKENLCQRSRYTGWDANGGYAQYATAPIDYIYPLEPLLTGQQGAADYSEQTAAPLLCAGIIGFRALKRTGLLDDFTVGQAKAGSPDAPVQQYAPICNHRTAVLGLYGFGGSAHITAQVALALGMRVHVLTRGEQARKLAVSLGCSSAGGAYDMPPEPLDAAIIFAPVGDIVPPALRALRPGGVLSIAGIHMSDVPPLNYERELFHEKEVRSVESNTREDGREFLAFAQTHQLNLDTHSYDLSQAQQALKDLKAGAFAGAAVLVNG